MQSQSTSERLLLMAVVPVQALALVGEFNNWQPTDDHWAQKNEFGTWSLFLPDNEDGTSAVPHRCTFSPTGLDRYSTLGETTRGLRFRVECPR